MGSWNGTCGVSNLPIRYGDKVRAVLIVGDASSLGASRYGPAFRTEDWKASADPTAEPPGTKQTHEEHEVEAQARRWRDGWWSGYCHHDGIFYPRLLPIRGTYDDYGGVENLEGLAPAVAHAQFQTDLMEFPKGRFDTPPEINKSMPIEGILKAVERGSVTIYGIGRGSAPVGLWLVHENIYQAVVDTPSADRWGERERTKEHYREEIPGYLEVLQEMASDTRTHEDFDSMDIFRTSLKIGSAEDNELQEILKDTKGTLSRIRRQVLDMTAFHGALRPRALSTTGPHFVSAYLHNEFAANRLEAGNPEVRELVTDLADFLHFQNAMQSMRKGWMPQPGSGSQDDSMEFHCAVAEATLDHVEAYEKKWAEENE